MSSKTKRLTTALFALAAAVCLALALFFGATTFRTASADGETTETGVNLTDADLVITSGVITDLKADAKTAIDGAKGYTLTISGTAATSIAEGAIYSPKKLTEFTVTSAATGFTTIGQNAFKDCFGLTSVDLSGSHVTTIGDSAFYGTSVLTTLNLGEALETIGKSAFALSNNVVSKLETITVPASVKSIGDLAFAYRAYNLTKINFDAAACNDFVSITGDSYTAISKAISDAAKLNPFFMAGANSTGVTVEIGSTVTKIPAGLFLASNQAINKITTVNFNNVTLADKAFGGYSFSNCNNLKQVAFVGTTNIASIGECAFYNCTSINNITLPTGLKAIGRGAFYNCKALTGISIPTGVQTIEDSVFRSCDALSSVNLGNVKTISANAFYQCIGLVSITIPGSVTEIGENAFADCTNLKQVHYTSDSALTIINKNAFKGCSSLTNIIIPANVTGIGNSAYTGCTAVTQIEYYAKSLTYDFSESSATHPFGSVGSKGTGIAVKIGSDSFEINKLPVNLFYYKESPINVTSVNFTNVKAEISGNAFRNCSNLTSVVFGGECSITKIGSSAFNGCTALPEFDMPDAVTEIGPDAFSSCQSILKITLPEKLASIGNNAFSGCARLFVVVNLSSLSLTIGSSEYGGVAKNAVSIVTSDNASDEFITSTDSKLGSVGLHFINKDGKYYLIGAIGTLAGDVVLPDYVPNTETSTKKVYDIYKFAFQNLNQITSVTIPSTVGKIEDHAFYQCKALKKVEIKENNVQGVSEIGTHAFANCTSLTEVDLPSKLNEIASDLFQYCTALTQITIPASVTKIGSMAFQYSGLTSVEIPANVSMIDSSAFDGCRNLTSVTFLTKKVNNRDTYSLTNIGFGAFENCTSLNAIKIPNTVTKLDNDVFKGASSLLSVYLPDSASYGTGIFSGCNAELVIISKDKDAYANDKPAIDSQRLTYMVDVNFIYDNEHTIAETVKKLYGFNYTYTLQSDNLTWKNNGTEMPVQEGYSLSNWYSEYGSQNKLNAEAINAKLQTPQVTSIDLYAHYVAKPNVIVNSLNFKDLYDGLLIEETNLREINETLFKSGALTTELVFAITAYKPFVGTSNLPNSVREAGDYTITVTLATEFGVWDAPYEINFTVEKWVIDLGDPEVLDWGIKNENGSISNLSDGTLWVPKKGVSGDPYIKPDYGTIENGYEEISVTGSVTRYSGKDWEVAIKDTTGIKYTVSGYSYTKGKNIGKYTAEALVTPSNNYSLRAGTITPGYGITCTPNNASDGSYTVKKDWYIVAIANTLWAGENSNSQYSIDGWTYNQENIESSIPAAPTLAYGDNNLIKLSLSLEAGGDKTDVLTNADYGEYSRWINKSMPAGKYTLKINVNSTEYGDETVANMEKTFVFTVAPATLDEGIASNLVSQVNAQLNGKTFEYAYDRLVHIAYDKVQSIIDGVSETDLNPNRKYTTLNGWSDPAYSGFFGRYSIAYNIITMPNDNYVSSSDIDASAYAPSQAGEYTVCYQLSAPNYEPLVVSNANKRDYSFNVIIYELINVSLLINASYTYTGSPIIPVTSNERYQVISLEAGETIIDSELLAKELTVEDRNYTDVGSPKIALKLNNSVIYRWQKADNDNTSDIFGSGNDYLLLGFEIVRCENSTTRALDIIRWSWGNYNAKVNLPIWGTKFGPADDHTFELISANSKVYKQEEFGTAPAGEYTLRATAAGGEGYNWEPFKATATINILKADNYWDVVPTVYDWSYGEYATRVAGPAATPHFGTTQAVSTSYYKLNADGVIEGAKYDSMEKLLVDGELPVGQYLMRVEVAGAANYNAMPVTDIRFRVSKAHNNWVDVPYVIGWSEGHYNKVENKLNAGSAKLGEVVVTITDSKGNVIDVDNLGSLSIGNYTVTAYVAGTDNYYEMQPITTTFAVVEDTVSTTGLIASTMVFAVLAVGLAVAAVVLLILRSRKMEAEFRKMIKKELGRK